MLKIFNSLFKNKGTDHEKHLIRTFEENEIIVFEGDVVKEMFIIRSGQVAVEKKYQKGSLRLKVLGKGEFFGEMALMEGLPRSATVKALTKTSVLVLNSGSFMIKLRRDPTLAFEMINQLCHRLRSENDRFSKLVTEAGISNEICQKILDEQSDTFGT